MFPLNSIVLSLALTAYLLAYAGVAARVLMLLYFGFIFMLAEGSGGSSGRGITGISGSFFGENV